MGTLSYGMIASLDGFVTGPDGSFAWAEPDEETHQFINDRDRHVGTYLYGRRMYEIMRVWADDGWLAGEPEVLHDYAGLWRAADKVVYSTTLAEPGTDRTRIERAVDADAVRSLKAASPTGLSVAGPGLASVMLAAGLVDELAVYVAPAVLGGGTPLLPRGLRLTLKLVEEHRFASGFVYLRYAVAG